MNITGGTFLYVGRTWSHSWHRVVFAVVHVADARSCCLTESSHSLRRECRNKSADSFRCCFHLRRRGSFPDIHFGNAVWGVRICVRCVFLRAWGVGNIACWLDQVGYVEVVSWNLRIKLFVSERKNIRL